jgi:hypothetical protein
MEQLERETFTRAMRRTETEGLEGHLVGLEDRLKDKDRPTEAPELGNLQVSNGTTEYDGMMRDRTSDFYVVAQLANGDAYHTGPHPRRQRSRIQDHRNCRRIRADGCSRACLGA